MKQRTIIIVLSILLAASVGLNLGGIGMFALMRIRACGHIEQSDPPLIRRLKLTEAQSEALKNSRRELSETIRPLREEMRFMRQEVVELLMQEELDSAKRDSLFREIAELQTEMEMLVFNKFFETKSVLNPEQQGLLLQMIEGEFHGGQGPPIPGPHNGHKGPGQKLIEKHIQERREK